MTSTRLTPGSLLIVLNFVSQFIMPIATNTSSLATRAHNPQLNSADAMGISVAGAGGAIVGSTIGGLGVVGGGLAVGLPALAVTGIGALLFGTAAAIWTQADKIAKYNQSQAKPKAVTVQAVVVDEYLESLENDLDNHFQWLATGQF